MIEMLVTLLIATLPTCPTEDSYLCTFEAGQDTIINLTERDPAPISIRISN